MVHHGADVVPSVAIESWRSRRRRSCRLDPAIIVGLSLPSADRTGSRIRALHSMAPGSIDRMETVREPVPDLPIATLEVEVVEGPDSGMRKAAEAESLTVGTAESNDVILRDAMVSRFHAEFVRRPDGVLVVDLGSTNGTFVGATRIERAVVPPGTRLRTGATMLRVGDGAGSAAKLFPGDSLGGITGQSPAMRRLMAQIEKAASSEASVLVTGESGTGKELVATAIHALSARAAKPLVVVDCGSLAPTLVASELFGHERGAFTGANGTHIGAIERAHGGTVFFDELGELPQSLQSTLLGVLQRRRFRRLGGKRDIDVDVRVVSATNRELKSEVNAGAFRLDLYYRLAVVTLRVPPLRDRPEDIPLLVERFLRECGHEGPVAELLSAATLEQLQRNRWAGNVRELRNLIEATMALGELPPESQHGPAIGGSSSSTSGVDEPLMALPYKQARAELLARFEATYVERLLARAGGNVSRAARDAKMDRSHLIDLAKRHGSKP